jgi:hypothetical protein
MHRTSKGASIDFLDTYITSLRPADQANSVLLRKGPRPTSKLPSVSLYALPDLMHRQGNWEWKLGLISTGHYIMGHFRRVSHRNIPQRLHAFSRL